MSGKALLDHFSMLEDPRQCHFDPVALQCQSGVTPDCNCLTPKEVAAVRKIWEGPRSTDGDRGRATRVGDL